MKWVSAMDRSRRLQRRKMILDVGKEGGKNRRENESGKRPTVLTDSTPFPNGFMLFFVALPEATSSAAVQTTTIAYYNGNGAL